MRAVFPNRNPTSRCCAKSRLIDMSQTSKDIQYIEKSCLMLQSCDCVLETTAHAMLGGSNCGYYTNVRIDLFSRFFCRIISFVLQNSEVYLPFSSRLRSVNANKAGKSRDSKLLRLTTKQCILVLTGSGMTSSKFIIFKILILWTKKSTVQLHSVDLPLESSLYQYLS
jgi:hypothetical protein